MDTLTSLTPRVLLLLVWMGNGGILVVIVRHTHLEAEAAVNIGVSIDNMVFPRKAQSAVADEFPLIMRIHLQNMNSSP